jgi:hypothetical protein
MQIRALIEEMPGLPAEIEVRNIEIECWSMLKQASKPICRDLWAMYVSQKIDFVAQPYLEKAAKERESSAAPAESSKDAHYAARRAAQAERDAILEEEWEQSQLLQEQLRDVGVVIEQDDLVNQTDVTERGATSSEWESAWDQDSGEEDNKDIVLAPKKRRKRGKGKRIERHEGHILQRKSREEVETLLSILHLGLVTLRVPVIWADLCT